MECSICYTDKFIGTPDRLYKVCKNCGAMERQRALWKMLQIKNNDTVLEIAPLTKKIFGGTLKSKFSNIAYIGVDKYANGHPNDKRDVSFCDKYFDLVDLSKNINEKTINVFIMQHVLEEIVEYITCLKSIYNVLANSGIAYLELPHKNISTHISTPANSFGNVWQFSGSQLLAELKYIFDNVELVPYNECGTVGSIFVCQKN